MMEVELFGGPCDGLTVKNPTTTIIAIPITGAAVALYKLDDGRYRFIPEHPPLEPA